MKPGVIIISWVCIGISLGSIAQAEPRELSRAEANTIVRERVEATREQKRVRLAEMDTKRAVSRKVIDKGARTVTIERIEPDDPGSHRADTPRRKGRGACRKCPDEKLRPPLNLRHGL